MRRYIDIELDGPGVLLVEGIGVRADLPGGCAVEVLYYADRSRRILCIADSHLIALDDCVVIHTSEVGPGSFSGQVEGISQVNADGLVFRRMVEGFFSDELEASV